MQLHIQCFMFSQYDKKKKICQIFSHKKWKLHILVSFPFFFRILRVTYRAGCDVHCTTPGISWAPPQLLHFGSQVAIQHQPPTAGWQNGHSCSKNQPMRSEAEEIISPRKGRRWYWPSALSGGDLIGFPQQSGAVGWLGLPGVPFHWAPGLNVTTDWIL